ncbi:MAG TPA: fructose-6-phosphate aldolase [Candidatus Paceibacterota bacterium]|nr:fructose-6-phosphate aldolase [Verrucomicrobiota bacterium]HOX03075.1 fructose-6-phosphate aldolase [Verrucomicrobiota bacterium]HRZ45965.1 fructose-6-phosphate aldolase [Candidatus Paceibacterota bacterium]HRZ92946.1 fructose-6-phosphate aldolase [Candidatus Paceibacterota bacterium]
MKLFIDTADVAQIREAWSWGILDGATTNPSHVAKTGRQPADVYREICDIVDGPISLEAVSLTAAEIVKEGRELARLHHNVVIKVPIMKEGLKAVKMLAAEGFTTNVTVNFSPLQALLAAKAGATYISPFVGRLDAVGHDGMELVRQIKAIYENYGFPTQIITAAVRHPQHVLQAALAGSHVATMGFDVLEQLYLHPLTDAVMDLFLKDWAKISAR